MDEQLVTGSVAEPVIPPVLDRLARRGILVAAPERDVAKGSVWTVEAGADGRLTSARLAFAP